MEATLRGTVVRTTFRAADGGFTVLRVTSQGSSVAVVGQGLALHDGEEAVFTGSWAEHPRFGRQFRVASCTPIVPETRLGIRRFLASGLVKGVGDSTADKLVEAFGDRTLEVLDQGEAALAKVPGIGQKRARTIVESYRQHRAYRDLLVFLQTYGVGPSTAMKVHKRYGAMALERVRENPYRLAMEVKGIGFKTADRLALALGMDADSPERAMAGVLYVLEQALAEGNLYVPFEELLGRAEAELKVPGRIVADAMLALDVRRLIVRDGDAIYLADSHRMECVVADDLRGLASRDDPERGEMLEGHLEAARLRLGFDLAPEQVEAVRQALTRRILAITGGPGTGKTTLVRAITAVAGDLSLRVELASPTGRAAKRLADATGEPARTIHRLLEFDPEGGAFQRHAGKPLRCDLLLVDESSMIDLALMAAVLEALPARASLVLVGDADQLPSVGPGTVFRDLVACGRIPVVRLSHIFRQARGSLIVENAHRILRGEMPEVPDASEVDQGQDFFLVPEEDPARLVERIKTLVKERIPARFRFDAMRDVQVLSPMHRGVAGVSSLNRELQALLNPGGAELRHGDQRLRVGDKVMQLRNDYDKEVYNGDIGRLVHLDAREGEVTVEVDGRAILYRGEELSDLQLAYATSVHKSQGSEYPAVVVVLAREHYVMCQRNLLYTAVTRGKALTIVAGSRGALRRAVGNDQVQRRYGKLAERIAAREA